MKPKVGKCVDCPPGSKEQPLIAKRCQLHYWIYRASLKKDKPKDVVKAVNNKALNVFFASQILQIPKCCEECGKPFVFFAEWTRRAAIAHILPKRERFGFPSVATHPQNKWFGCIDCHTNYDNLGGDFVKRMKIFPELVKRVQELIPLLTKEERGRVPDYFLIEN